LGSIGRQSQYAKTSGQWRLTEPQKCRAADLYAQGHSLGMIAKQFNVSRQSRWDVLRRRMKLRDRIDALPRKEPNAIRRKRLAALRRYRSRANRITREQILEVRKRDQVCCHCGGMGTDIDHIIQVSKGGQTELSNLQLLCRPCHHNKSRQDRKEV
jgi:5-methylcytosine-specific restriction endonuclease McrA